MPMPQRRPCTSEDYWNLPEGCRAELIEGVLYNMAPPSPMHQRIVAQLVRLIGNHIERVDGSCAVYPAPFAVNLDADDGTWVEPDVSVVCDAGKVSARGCEGAPDLVIEVVSPSSQRMDYITKTGRYERAGVREYWIVDPAAGCTTVYRFASGSFAPKAYPLDTSVPSGIFEGLAIEIASLL